MKKKTCDISIKVGWKKSKLPTDYKEKWKALLKTFKESSCAGVCPMFLAELLGILSGKEPGYSGSYSGYDMFGSGGESWKVFAGDLSIHRYRDVGEISESWSSVEKKSDETEVSGFPKGMELKWDGDFSCTGMNLTVKGVSEDNLARIRTLAENLFKDQLVEVIK